MNYKLWTARSGGFTLLLSVLIASLLLSIGLSIFNIALKELILSSSGRDSQFAFYAADSGTECALYWDIKESAFSTTSPRTITCNNQNFEVGGGESSSFTMNFPPEPYCATVSVLKQDEATIIESRGYNTCSQQNPRRVERGIRVRY